MILLVDDNAEVRAVLADFLSSHGYEVQTAGDGREALSSLTNSEIKPTVILLNLIMPLLDGWGFLAEFRKSRQFTQIPVIILSGLRAITERAQKAGAVAVMRKPVEPETLLRVLQHFASRA